MWKKILIMKIKLFLIFFTLFLFSTFYCQGAELKVWFLDVGEGEAIFIKTPDKKSVLIDTGNLISGFEVVKFLHQQNVLELDALIITHPHLDHMGGVFHVLQQIKTLKHFDNGQNFKNSRKNDALRWYASIFRENNYQALQAGENITLGEVSIDVLSPGKLTADWNTNSLVLKVSYGANSFLLMGDANIEAQNELLRQNIDLKADILKVGHHGAADSLSPKFITAVSPLFAVISVDANNLRGYPAQATLKMLQHAKVKVLLTSVESNIVFAGNGEIIARTSQWYRYA